MTTSKRTIELILTTSSALLCALPAMAVTSTPIAPAYNSAQAPASASSRLLGTITTVSGSTLTVKTDAGSSTTVTVNDDTRLLRTQPGQKTLTGATKIALTDLAPGDRVLIMLTSADGSPATANTVIAISHADIAEKQQAEQADWQKRGIGGLVKSIDPATGVITLASGARTITVKVAASTVIRRYAPDSIRFTDAKTSSLDAIHPGDQLTARGDRNADGSEVAAEEIVTGSFRNIAGTVTSIDSAAGTMSVKDLLTKKQVTIRISTDSQMHKLDTGMAQVIAARLKNASAGAASAAPAGAAQGAGQRTARSGGSAGSGSGSGGDLSRAMQRAPVIQLSDLHKGDAIMIVATDGNPDTATAVTLLAGVEPMLEASASASQSMFSASWNLGGGGDQGSAQ